MFVFTLMVSVVFAFIMQIYCFEKAPLKRFKYAPVVVIAVLLVWMLLKYFGVIGGGTIDSKADAMLYLCIIAAAILGEVAALIFNWLYDKNN